MRQAYGRYRGNSLARKSYGMPANILGAARSATANQSPACPGLWTAMSNRAWNPSPCGWAVVAAAYDLGRWPPLRGQPEAHTMTAQDQRTGPEVSTAPWV